MKKFISSLLLLLFFSCTKKDLIETSANGSYQLRIAAMDNSGARSYTPISRVKAGKVAIEFETAEVSDVKQYDIEVSADGISFKAVKAIAADLQTPNRLYRDTIVLD